MRLSNIAAALLAVIGFSSNVHAALLSQPTKSNPAIDGVVSPGEWNAAGTLSDGNGLAGTTYAEWRDGLNYSSWSYSGRFSFLLHNIEQNTTFSNGAGGTDPAFNVFDIYTPDDAINKYLEVTVRYDGFSVDKYNSSGVVIGSRSFTYALGLAPNETSNYDWNNYFGVYARGGYGNSAFTSGLTGAVNNNNQLFEVAYLNPTIDVPPVRRSVKDPDQQNNWQVVTYIDTTVVTVPEPSSFALLGIGLSALVVSRRRKPA